MSKKNMRIEEILVRLEAIADALESGELPLEESLKVYGEATELVKQGEKKLNEAQLKIERLDLISRVGSEE